MVRRLELILLILLMAVSASAVDLDSTRQVRVAAYRLLQMDTTGNNALSTGVMDQWANMAINKVNEDLGSYRRTKLATMTDGSRLYVLDSCIQVTQCLMVTNDSIWGLEYIDLDNIERGVPGIINKITTDFPTHYYIWGDSIGFIPTPVRSDSFWVFYTHLIPEDSMRLLPYNHRYGVVLYTAYLAALDVGKDPTLILSQYNEFISTRKPKAIEGKQ